jgi:glycosyltransferase involved in cell wall biosynthesis
VLIEAAALGVPIAAMDTGGTRDIISDEATGLLSRTPDEFAEDVARLTADTALGERLAAAARAHVRRTFDAPLVVGRVEALYQDLLRGRTDRRRANPMTPDHETAESRS